MDRYSWSAARSFYPDPAGRWVLLVLDVSSWSPVGSLVVYVPYAA